MAQLTNQEWRDWNLWFAAKQLGDLEDVREFVEMAALENASDTDDILSTAKYTVDLYLDDKEMAKEFDFYRK